MSARTLVPALLALLFLVVPAVAGAKGVAQARVCGPAACADALTDETVVIFDDGPAARPPSKGAPFYELRYRMATGDAFSLAFVPSAGLVRGDDGTWLRPDARAVAAVGDIAAGLRPFPAARLGLSRPPAAPPPDARAHTRGGGVDTVPAILGGTALALLAAGAAAATARRRRRPAAG